MFRYIAFAWDQSRASSVAAARRLTPPFRSPPDWTPVLERPGLAVFTTGSRTRINGSYALGGVQAHGGQGMVLGRLFRRSALHPMAPEDIQLSDREIQQVLADGGRSLVADFWGRYVAFLPSAAGGTCVLRDPSGTLPCFLVRVDGVSIVFSWLDDVLGLLSADAQPRVHWDALAAFTLWGILGARETALRGVSQILPGEAFDLQSGNAALLWSAVDIAGAPSLESAADAEALLRETVRSCVRAWASCYDTILLRLSGGLDSSILLSCLAPADTNADVLCLNYHSPGSDSDEREYARLAATHVGRDLIERARDTSFRIERIATMAPMPVPFHYAGSMNSKIDAAMATAHSAEAIFTGAGGDPLFFEIPRWWPAADYLRVAGWNAGFGAAVLDAARLGRVSVWQAAALAALEWLRPGAAAREAARDTSPFAGHGVLKQAFQRTRFTHPELAREALSVGKQMQTAALMQPLAYYDPFEQGRAPERVNPLFSQPLVELALRIPTYILTEGGRGRALARRAFASSLPRQIVNRRSKGGLEEHVKDILLANLDYARGMLVEGELVRRSLLDRALVQEMFSERPSARPTPLGQIHALVGIEAWVARWPR